jgi:membrane fusion protein (multidrug efflux system)
MARLHPVDAINLVAIFPEYADVVLVPERAILEDQGGSYVLVVGPDDTVAYRRVVSGVVHDGWQQVREGLAAGERVVTDGVQKTRPGARVVVGDGPPRREAP